MYSRVENFWDSAFDSVVSAQMAATRFTNDMSPAKKREKDFRTGEKVKKVYSTQTKMKKKKKKNAILKYLN